MERRRGSSGCGLREPAYAVGGWQFNRQNKKKAEIQDLLGGVGGASSIRKTNGIAAVEMMARIRI